MCDCLTTSGHTWNCSSKSLWPGWLQDLLRRRGSCEANRIWPCFSSPSSLLCSALAWAPTPLLSCLCAFSPGLTSFHSPRVPVKQWSSPETIQFPSCLTVQCLGLGATCLPCVITSASRGQLKSFTYILVVFLFLWKRPYQKAAWKGRVYLLYCLFGLHHEGKLGEELKVET